MVSTFGRPMPKDLEHTLLAYSPDQLPDLFPLQSPGMHCMLFCVDLDSGLQTKFLRHGSSSIPAPQNPARQLSLQQHRSVQQHRTAQPARRQDGVLKLRFPQHGSLVARRPAKNCTGDAHKDFKGTYKPTTIYILYHLLLCVLGRPAVPQPSNRVRC